MSFSFSFQNPSKKTASSTKSRLESAGPSGSAIYASTEESVASQQLSPDQLVFRLKEEGNTLAELGMSHKRYQACLFSG